MNERLTGAVGLTDGSLGRIQRGLRGLTGVMKVGFHLLHSVRQSGGSPLPQQELTHTHTLGGAEVISLPR